MYFSMYSVILCLAYLDVVGGGGSHMYVFGEPFGILINIFHSHQGDEIRLWSQQQALSFKVASSLSVDT